MNLQEITFRLTNVIPERIIFVIRGIAVFEYMLFLKKGTVPGKRQDVCVLWEEYRFLTKLPVAWGKPGI